MISTAVVLAAGLGSRLGKRTEKAPKGFLDFKGKALIVRSVERMKDAGITEVLVGVGYLADSFRELEQLFPEITFVFFENEQYADTGSMYTLFCGRELIKNDFLLFESDLLYEPFALSSLLKDPRPDVVLASGFTSSGDEVWIESGPDNVLRGMSKRKEDLSGIDGELVGITKLSVSSARLLFDFIPPSLHDNPKMDYEQALVLLSKKRPVYVKKIEDLAWCEIDNEDHLKRAEMIVFPKILEKQAVRK